ncbi:phosphomethylpyrimidine kinase [Kiloniella litopenaei]|uniref:Phosphomethylpyrimidine kinase n=1 Tax=Kiloniella litopenaei TaxID=1549748 RepID=A0A0M2R2C9_9PROT|nr:DUF2779 domain-containing protein [Kiloniella litopenaei]KKJ75801.1 phosphomethylpyrimidine kinase [Kiloniella litopenaei]
MELTKTNFIHYLSCPKSFWVYKKDNENYPDGNFTAFMQKLTRESDEVMEYVHTLFEASRNSTISYHKTFRSNDGLLTKIDCFEVNAKSQTCLYEVKSSTSIKKSGNNNHIKDACFQTITAERSGQKIDKIILIYLNGKYVRKGAINPKSLLIFEDVTDEVRKIYAETSTEINQALHLLAKAKIDLKRCSCIYKSKAHHCDTFEYFNPDISNQSIYNLPRLSPKKRKEFLMAGIMNLQDVPVNYLLSEIQTRVLRSAQSGEPQIDRTEISDTLKEYQYPLYFFDYETYASAVPLIDGVSPHKHFPIQYSLHILEKDGTLTHKDFLQHEAKLPLNLIEQMEEDFGETGSIVSWHASFERKQNQEMAKWYPEKRNFLNDINSRLVNLEDVFKLAYVDAHFDGSTSIKKVLPIICPHLDFKELNIQDGTSAMDAWEKMIAFPEIETKIQAKALLSYCEMDTFAMVEIYRFLIQL